MPASDIAMGNGNVTGGVIRGSGSNHTGTNKTYVSGASGYPPNNKEHTIHENDFAHSHSKNATPNEASSQNQQQQQIPLQTRIQPPKMELDTKLTEVTVEILQDNNIKYMPAGLTREYVSGASAYPPDLDFSGSNCIECLDDSKEDISLSEVIHSDPVYNCHDGGIISNVEHKIELKDVRSLLYMVAQNQIKLNHRTVTLQDILEPGASEKEYVIKSRRIKWWINVPLRMKNTIEMVQMLADPGANTPCLNTRWAYDNYKQFIRRNSTKSVLLTPGGEVRPKYVLWMTFPTKSGKILKARFFLVDDLPVNILADINMLIAFGYEFKSGLPPVFTHKAQSDDLLDLKTNDELTKVNNTSQSRIYEALQRFNRRKLELMRNQESYNRRYNAHFVQLAECGSQLLMQELDNTHCVAAINDMDSPETQINEVHVAATTTEAMQEVKIDTDDNNSATEALNAEVDADMARERLFESMENASMPGMTEVECGSQHTSEVYRQINLIESGIDIDINDELGDITDITINSQSLLTVDNLTTFDNSIQENENHSKFEDILSALTTDEDDRRSTTIDFMQLMHTEFEENDSNTHQLFGTRRTRYTRGLQRMTGRIGNSSVKLTNNLNHTVNFINFKHGFLADKQELKKAQQMKTNTPLEFNKLEYLKELERLYPHKFMQIYKKTRALIDKYRDRIFAKRMYDRRTLFVKPVRLGIKEEHRDKVCYVPQYNIPPKQRQFMINYTWHNDLNGFWQACYDSTNCIPYTMVAKKDSAGKISRYRPAFDARVVNQYCELIPSNMPTIRDFDEFFARRGLITIADCKNYFDCIPLDERDQAWAVVLTPLGLRKMQHLTYGWMNAAPIAQNIMNQLSLSVGFMLGYIDDIAIKHPWHWDTDQLIGHLEKFFKEIEKRNILLHPGKFWPFTTAVDSLGIRRTLDGSEISKSYKDKVLSMKKPTNVAELRTAIGVMGYIGRYIRNFGFFKYWLQDLVKKAKPGQRLTWTREADYAWEKLVHNIRNANLLRNPTRNGVFCVKTDACNYGIGGVLYQWQWDEKLQRDRWFIIDMWSTMVPERLRKTGPIILEAYALTKTCEHWQFHLIKRKFKVACDNSTVVRVFDPNTATELDQIAKNQLARLKQSMALYTFSIEHVSGVQNELADGLSRFAVEFNHGNPIQSVDTGNRELTEDDHAVLKQKQNNTTTQAKMQAITNLAHRRMDDYRLNGNIMMLDSVAPFKSDDERMAVTRKFNKELFHQICQAFNNKAEYRNYQQIQSFIDGGTANLVANVESAFNALADMDMVDRTMHILRKRTKITPTIKECVQQAIQQPPKQQMPITDADSEWINNICTTLEHTALPIDKPMETRNQRRIRQGKQQKKEFRVDYVLPEADEMIERTQTRDEFIHKLLGYRNLVDFFGNPEFLQYQQSDVILQTMRQLVTREIWNYEEVQNAKLKRDLDHIKATMPRLYLRWISGDLRINKNDILQARIWSVKTSSHMWVDIVPLVLRGKMLDYMHHNMNLQHLGDSQTYDALETQYWWPDMKRHTKRFVDQCTLCQYCKHGKTYNAPMRIRDLPKPRDLLMADFLGPIMRDYYILVLIDYGSNYTMLVPTVGSDARMITEALVSEWIPVFGWFNEFESDYGPGFDSNIMKSLFASVGIDQKFAEARNHRGIGKVERIIGFIQSIINLYNVESDYDLINKDDSKESREEAWEKLMLILPFIQQSINRRKPRFTQFSPNMLMFGSELNDLTNIRKAITNMQEWQDKMKPTDYEYVTDLLTELERIQKTYNDDWQKYAQVSKEMYDKKHHITAKTTELIAKKFKINTKVLYYIGDRAATSRKWRQRWTGPWTITKIQDNSIVEITDPELNNSKWVSIDRVKLWNDGQDTISWMNYTNYDDYKFALQQSLQQRHQL